VRAFLLAVATLVLLGVVAAASKSDAPSRPGDPQERTLPLAFWDYAVTLGVIAIVVVVFLAVLLKVPLQGPARGRFGLTQFVALAILLGIVTFAGSRYEWPEVTYPGGVEDIFVEGNAEREPQSPGESAERDSRTVRFRGELFFIAGGVLLLGIGIYIVQRRGGLWRRLEADADAASALSAALDESVDDLRAERDARRAVIAAYARMERTLERHGLPRWAYEAPLEYLARVLRELRVRSGSVLALTELFERAKFSPHAIDAEMKDEAIGALIAVRDDLRAEA
jgi:hypothetical protein